MFLTASVIEGGGSIDVRGGVGAAAGRVLLADGVATVDPVGSSLAFPVTPVQVTRTAQLTPQNTLPYFPGIPRPLIVRSSAVGVDLVGGVAPCGILPTDAMADPDLVAARAGAPSNAILAIVQHETGPLGFATERSLLTTSGPNADTLTLYNVIDTALSNVTLNGAVLGTLPFSRQTLFGGPGTLLNTSVGAGRAWIVCTPEGPLNITLSAGGVTRTLVVPDGTTTQTLYLLATCGDSDVASPGPVAGPDGELTADDVIFFITWFGARDVRADVAGPGPTVGGDGEFTADDIILFISRFTGGC